MKHKVEYLFPGAFLPEWKVQEIAEHDPELARQQAPSGAFCFVLFDEEEPPDLDLGPNFLVVPVAQNKSGRYYLGGTLYTVPELKDQFPYLRILIANAEGNHWERMIQCPTGNWQPFMDEDVLLTAV